MPVSSKFVASSFSSLQHSIQMKMSDHTKDEINERSGHTYVGGVALVTILTA